MTYDISVSDSFKKLFSYPHVFIPTGEGKFSPPITTGTPNVFQLPASLSDYGLLEKLLDKLPLCMVTIQYCNQEQVMIAWVELFIFASVLKEFNFHYFINLTWLTFTAASTA